MERAARQVLLLLAACASAQAYCASACVSGPAPVAAAPHLTAVASRHQPLRVAVWGDSHTASGDFLQAWAAASGVAPGELQAAQIPLQTRTAGWRPMVKRLCLDGWQAADGGIASLAPGSSLTADFRWPDDAVRATAATVRLLAQDPSRPLLVSASTDDGWQALLPVDGPLLRIRPPNPFATLELRVVAGQARIAALQPEYAQPATVLLDNFSVPGAKAQAASIVRGSYDLVLLQYGTNEAADDGFRADDYQRVLRGVVARVRAAEPNARCVLLGPPDRGATGRDPLRFARVHAEVARVQQAVAAESGCRFWNWQQAMGGPGGAAAWARAVPPLMQADLTHLTPRGYEASARAFAAALPGLLP